MLIPELDGFIEMQRNFLAINSLLGCDDIAGLGEPSANHNGTFPTMARLGTNKHTTLQLLTDLGEDH